MREPRLDLVEAALEPRPFGLRLRIDHALDARDLIGITGPQILERLLLCHVDASFQSQLAALGQKLSRAEQGIGDVLAVVRRGLSGKRVIDDPGVCDLFEGAIKIGPDPWPWLRGPPLNLGRIDLAGARRVVHDTPIEPPRGLQTHAEPLGLFHHGEAEIVVVEPVIATQEEELTLLRPAIQNYMCVGVIAILMHRDDVVEMSLFGLKEPLGDIGGDVAHVLAPGADRIGHQHMRRLSELGLEPRTPALGEPLRQVLDLRSLKPRLPIQEPAAVHDMRGLGGEVIKLVHELGFGMRAPAPDRLEDRRTMPRSGAHELPLPGRLQPLHRAPYPAPAIPEDLSGDVMDGIIQPHGRTPSERQWRRAASHPDDGAKAGRSRQRNRG